MNDDKKIVECLLSNGYLAGEDTANSRTDNLKMPFDGKRITDEMPGGFFIYYANESQKIIYANKALFRMFNCNTLEEFQEWTGNTFRGLVHPDDIDRVEESIKLQIANNQYDLDYVEYRIIQKGGNIRWVEDYGHFIHSEFAGDVFYVFLGDATEKRRRQEDERAAILHEKKQKERKLKKRLEAYDRELKVINQEQLRRLELIEGLSIDFESIFYANLNGNVIKPYRVSNRVAYQFNDDEQICQYAGFFSDYIRLWVHPEDQELVTRSITPAYIQERLSVRKSFHINYRIINDTKVEYLQLRIVNVGNSESVSQIVIGCRSVDDEIRHEMEQNRILDQALCQAKISNKAKNTFLSNMSHDIRTPMNAIVGFTALARNYAHETERLFNYLNKIDVASHQLLQLLDDVLELSRLESDRCRIEESACNLHDIIQDIQTTILPQAEVKGHQLDLDLSKLEHPMVYVDRQYLTQTILRLAGNAVKYTDNGGLITISVIEQKASSDFATFQFVVEDTGIGINANFLEHIFEPFERQKNTTLSGVQGTGLGLTIAKSIVEMMGGTIDVSSISGQGSRFTITLSLRLQSNQQQVLPPPLYLPPVNLETGRILLVEDNEINQEIGVELLESSGFLVDTAENGSVAVDKIKNSKPGDYFLILMDIQMPVMDGHLATKAIRELDDPALANIPIIALSANTFEEDRKKSMESGMNAHVAKPFQISQLLDLIETFINCTN